MELTDAELRRIIIELITNFFSFLLAGGIISLIVELIRFNREKKRWEKEDEVFEVTVPNPLIKIKYHKKPTTGSEDEINKQTVELYERGILDKVSNYVILGKIIIRNLTDQEIAVANIKFDTDFLPLIIPQEGKRQLEKEMYEGYSRFYYHSKKSGRRVFLEQDLQKYLLEDEDFGNQTVEIFTGDKKTKINQDDIWITISPKSTNRLIFIIERVGVVSKYSDVPSKIQFKISLSNSLSKTIEQSLDIVDDIPGIIAYNDQYLPQEYVDKNTAEYSESEDFDDIPF